MKRTVTIEFDIAFPYPKSDRVVTNAVGYLSSWAIGSTRHVNANVYGNADGDFYASYTDADGKETYSIFAQHQDGTEGDLAGYSFHS